MHLSARQMLCTGAALIGIVSVLARLLSGSRLNREFAPKIEYGITEVDFSRARRSTEGTEFVATLFRGVEATMTDEALLDSVIFIHGLGSNPDSSWRARSDTNASAYTQWIADFLPDDLPEYLKAGTRFYLYNYNSYWKRDAVATRLARMSGEMLTNIRHQIERPSGVRKPQYLGVGQFNESDNTIVSCAKCCIRRT